MRCTMVRQASIPYTTSRSKYVMSSVLIITLPMNNRINAIPMEPTSPAKHLAFPFGRKLKKQNTNTLKILTTIKEGYLNSPSFIKQHQRNQYRQRIPGCSSVLIPSMKLMTFVIPTVHNQSQDNHPPQFRMQDIQLIERHRCRSKLYQQTHRVRKRMNVIYKTDTSHHRQSSQEPRIRKTKERAPDPGTNQEDDSSPAQHH